MIPELIDNVLPEGIHSCTIEEVSGAFGRFWKTDQRIKLSTKLRQFVEEARKSGIAKAVIIDGSYVTGKPSPQDIDMIIALRADADLSQAGGSFGNLLLDRRAMNREYSVDARAVPDGSDKYLELVAFFSRVRPDDPDQSSSRTRKGLLRIELC